MFFVSLLHDFLFFLIKKFYMNCDPIQFILLFLFLYYFTKHTFLLISLKIFGECPISPGILYIFLLFINPNTKHLSL